MADNLKKTFTIEIAGVKESVSNLESLEDILVKMEKQVETINKNGGFSVVSKEANKNAKEAIDLAKAEQIAQGEVVSSYKDKQKALSTLGKEIKSMTVADGEAAKKQQEMIQQYNGLNDQLKRFDASMGNHQRNVGNYSGALKAAKEELKEIKAHMMGLDEFSAEFEEWAKRGGDVADRIDDINAAIKREASDTKSLDAVIDYAKSATAAFQLYKGAMSAFGLETKEAEEAMQQLVGAMNIVQSLQTLSETFKSTSATGQLLHKMLQLVGLEAKTTAAATTAMAAAENTAAASTTAMAAAENTADKATKGLNVGLKATRVFLASLGIGLVIMLVSELVEHWEDLVGWVNKLIPGLSKTGGLMNNLKGIVVGLGKAVVNWLINPWKTFANVIGKILSGDFEGAWKAALDGVKNQFAGTVDAFNNGYKKQIETGLEDIARKNAAVQDKILTHNKNMITKQKNADGTYRREYIEANKKMFENRKKMYKKDSDEYRKVLEDEAAFNQQIEDAKTAAAENGAKARASAAKKEAAEKKKTAEEEAKKQEELRKFRLKADEKLYRSTASYLEKQKELEIETAKANLEKYKNGPVEKYKEAMEALNGKLKEQETLQRQAKLYDFFSDYRNSIDESIESLDDFMKALNKIVEKSKEYGKVVSVEMFAEFAKENEIFKNLTEDQYKYLYGVYIDYVKDGLKNKEKEEKETNEKVAQQTIQIYKKTIDNLKSKLNELGSDQDLHQGASVYARLFNPKKAKKAEEEYKNYWQEILDETKKQEPILEETWNKYLESIKVVYTEDSKEYRDAQEEKKKALKEFLDFQKKAEQGAQGKTVPLKDGKINNQSPINKKESRTDAKGNTNWSALWDKDNTIVDNLLGEFKLLDEMVLGPAMDTFNMFMDFAIEETQARLDEVMDMHDDALEKVEESTNRIKELNDSLKDSSNTNIEVTKQQLADEQLLYAQRLAEEQKLAQEERALQNKANEQEYQQRKMELGYQLILGIANTAQGASKALAEWGWPLGPIFAGVMAALGAVQTALIAKQLASLPKPKKLADGGLLTGPSHKQGGIQVGRTGIEVEGGEAIINKRSTAKYLPLLDAINASGNGGKHTIANTDKRIRKFANGGTMNFENVDSNLRQNANTNKILNAMDKIDFNPVVSVVDFEKVQNRLVKVRSLAGR